MNKRNKATPASNKREYTHAGGLVYRLSNEKTPEFFIITGRNNPHHWILPRGHKEQGETLEETALREVREETGLIARILDEVGSFQYEQDDEFFKIKIFLMESVGGSEKDATEGRQWRWCSRESALTLLSFPDYRACVHNAISKLQKNLPF